MTANLEEIRTELEIENTLGLHARPAALFVQTAATFDSEIIIIKDGEEINGKSLMSLLMLAAGKGTVLQFIARGRDCAEAIEAITDLIKRKFNEE